MTENASTFKAKSTIKSADLEHRQKINFNIGRYNAIVPQGKHQFVNTDLARERAKNIKWKALETLDQQLEEFEMNFTKRGGKVIWAQNSQEALDEILIICKEKNCRTIVKSKSMVTEEIHLNEFLEKNNIESVETDLGEYIQQLDGEPPYHIVTPAMHKSKEDVAKLFEEKLGTLSNLSPEELTLVARQKLREKYTEAQIGITGANFIISDIGAISITENEGNARLSTAWPYIKSPRPRETRIPHRGVRATALRRIYRPEGLPSLKSERVDQKRASAPLWRAKAPLSTISTSCATVCRSSSSVL